ncbi:hypothetical protein [Neoactinobaculum massilliense]|uniref:hypothetical protein n=1 Tax=Neoactinobaculum massilliense TaxID=2364794 RepID=UPI000F528752|nr:hypothetical protein [Neoactinobaculum massilliense]
MSAWKSLWQIAKRGGPLLITALVTAGPEVERFLRHNPKLRAALRSKLSRGGGRQDHGGTGAQRKWRRGTRVVLEERVQVLREHVTYMFASAQTAEAAESASRWRRELESISAALPVLDAMSPARRRATRRSLEQRLDRLSVQILSATFGEDIEDAHLVDGNE